MRKLIFSDMLSFLRRITEYFLGNTKVFAKKLNLSIVLSILSVFISSATGYYQFFYEKDGLLFVPTKMEAYVDSNKIDYPVLIASFINHGTRSVSIFKLGISFVQHNESEYMICNSKKYGTNTLPWAKEYNGKEIYDSMPFVVPPAQVINKVVNFPMYTLIGDIKEMKNSNIDICVDISVLTAGGNKIQKEFPISRITIQDGKQSPPSSNYPTIEIID